MQMDSVAWVGVVVVIAVVGLLVILLAPWKSVRDEPPLDTDIETRLLLGEDPASIAADVDAADVGRGEVTDLDRERAGDA